LEGCGIFARVEAHQENLLALVPPPRSFSSKWFVMSSKAEEYRKRAQSCLEIARALAPGQKRTMLTDMAQKWLELAEEADQPVMQQQQIQPKDDDQKE
jgi:hypothetical protein